MKIKGPADYSGLPIPPDLKTDEGKPASKFEPDKTAAEPQTSRAKNRTEESTGFEKGLSQIARTAKSEGLQGEAVTNRVVDNVMEELFGKEFLSKPDAVAMREAISPFLAQDDLLMSKLNRLLEHWQKKSEPGK